MNSRDALIATTVFASLLSAVALGQANFKPKLVPGERWRQSMSMEMKGFKMPARTDEICLAKDTPNEAPFKPDKDCTMSDVQQRGNRFSAKMQCNGKEKMEGTIESTTEGDRTYGRMTASSKDGEMVMAFDNTRLGTACQAEDWSGYVPPQSNITVPPPVDVCQMQGENLAKYALSSFVQDYAGKGQCSRHASKRKFCDAVKSPAGYHSLNTQEKSMSAVQVGAGEDPDAPFLKPLKRSMEACDLGTGPEATARLQASLIPVAQANNDWEFQLAYGDDAVFAQLVETAKAQCSGRAYTNASNRRYARLCNPYGAALVRNDREAVRQIAANGYDPGPTAPASAGAGGNAASGTAEPARRGDAQPADGSQPPSTKDKAKDALDAGKKALRGIFGR